MQARRISSLLILLFAVLSCGKPDYYREFMGVEETRYGVFSFDIPLERAVYDFSFFSRMEKPFGKSSEGVSFPMDVFWKSPSGQYFEERVWFVAGWDEKPVVEYRKGVLPLEEGNWTISVILPSEVETLAGLGLVCNKTGISNGTR